MTSSDNNSKQNKSSMPKMISFQEKLYYDDRLFVLHLCKGKVDVAPDGLITTTVYHENAPEDFIWCLATYKNCERYPAFSIKRFISKSEAELYLQQVEPTTPLISLGGKPPVHQTSYPEYLAWKEKCKLRDYDYKKLYSKEGYNYMEYFFEKK